MKTKILLFVLILNSLSLFHLQAGTTVSGTIQAPGPNGSTTTRSYKLYIPSSYNSSTPIPLIFNFHGTGGTSAGQQSMSGFDAIADTANFLVVYPQAQTQVAGYQQGSVAWTVTGTVAEAQNSDLKFVSMLLDTLKANYNINACRVYATGFSSGGYMTYEVGCYLNSLFAAIAPVSGVMLTQHYNGRNLTHPTPLFHTHGDNDGTVSYTASTGQEGVDNLVANFASYNGCSGPTTTTLTNSCTTDGCTVQSNIYTGGTNGSKVQKYKILGGTHSWPSATCGSTSGTNGDYGGAALSIWRFLRPFCLGDLTGGSCQSPAVTNQPSDQTVCSGSNTNIALTASGSGLTYQWQVDQGSGFSNVSNSAPYSGATTSTLTITSASTGLNGYKYKCVISAGSCVASISSNTITLTVNSCPTGPTATISGSTTVCQNAAAPTITFTGSGGTTPYTFTYKINGGADQTVSSSAGNSTVTIPASVTSSAGTYTYALVSVQDATPTTAAQTGNVVVTVNPLPSITGTTPAARCDAGTVTLGATASAGTVNWYDASANGNLLGTGTSFTTPSISANTTYYVDATNTGCTTATRTAVTATVNTTPSAPTVNSNSPVCVGSSINLSCSTLSNATYNWAGPNSFTSSSPTPTISSATTVMAGTYSVTVTLNNCTSGVGTTSVSVTQNAAPGVSIAITTGSNPTCTGQSITFTAAPSNGGGAPTYQWTVNGGAVGNNSDTYSSSNLTNSDNVACVLTSNSSCANPTTASSNTITITVSGQVVPSVSIATVSGVNTTCTGSSVTFTATPTNGGTTPSYQWMLNGGNVGTNSDTYTTSSLTNGQTISCVMTSNSSCVSTATATSNTITMSVTSTVTPAVIVTGTNTVCTGGVATFTAVPTNGGSAPNYQWVLNGNNVGTNSTIYSASLTNGQVVSCILTSNATCAMPVTASSNSLTMSVTPTVSPSISINISSGTNPTCSGSSVTFTATPTNGGGSPAYQWKVNNSNVGSSANTYTSTNFVNGDIISCVLTSNANCLTVATATSNSITLSVTTNTVTPSVAIASNANSICAGVPVTFTATPINAGTSTNYQWMVNGNNVGTNSVNYTSSSLTNGQTVSCNMTTTLSCGSSTTTSNTITMNVTPTITPAVSISVTAGTNPTCAGQPITFTAVPTNGGTTPSYQWKVNNGNVGTNSNTFTSTSLVNGDVVTCVLTSNATCLSTATANSNAITISITTPSAPTAVISGSNNICAGASTSFTATPVNGGTTPSYQWKLNGANVGINNSTYSSSSLTNGQAISCVMTSNSSCATTTTATSNTITMTVTSTLAPTVSIAITSGSNPMSPGQTITFSATPTNGGSNPTYQWKVNGSNVGNGGNTYTSSGFTSGDIVSCVITSNSSCASTLTAGSNTIVITVAATVGTPTVHVINTATANVKSSVPNDGGSPVTAKGIVWSTSPSPTTALSTQTNDGSGTGSFSSTMTGLSPGTTYYVRTYATTASGTVYGNEVIYTTPPPMSCTPDSTITLATPGIFPKSISIPNDNFNINQTFTYSVPFTYTNREGLVVDIDSSFLTGVLDIPPGLTYQCGRPNCIFYPGEIGCFVISGTLPNINDQAYYTKFTVTDYGVIHTNLYGDQALETYSPDYIADTTVFIVGDGGDLLNVETNSLNEFELVQSSPNPFNDVVTIKFTTPEAGNVNFYITDITGREMFRNNAFSTSGINTITYTPDNLSAGTYYFTISKGSKKITKLMLFIK